MSEVKFFYAIKTIGQLDFEGRMHFKDVVVGEGHLVYSEVLMCRQSRDSLMKKLEAKGKKEVAVRIEGVKTCKKCEEAYKANVNLAWKRWVEAVERAEIVSLDDVAKESEADIKKIAEKIFYTV